MVVTQRISTTNLGYPALDFPTGMCYKDVCMFCGGWHANGNWYQSCVAYNSTKQSVYNQPMNYDMESVYSIVCRDIAIAYSSSNYNSVQIFNFTTQIWNTSSISTTTAVLTSAVCVDNSMVILSGRVSYAYNINNSSWTVLNTPYINMTGVAVAAVGRQVYSFHILYEL